jgi:DNA-binding PadR family transcriptional regulator
VANDLTVPAHWFQILLALAEGELHGLAITRVIFERTGGRLQLWPGMLYGALGKMTDAGLVSETTVLHDGGSGVGWPRPYRLTARGRRVCAAGTEQLARTAGHDDAHGRKSRATQAP